MSTETKWTPGPWKVRVRNQHINGDTREVLYRIENDFSHCSDEGCDNIHPSDEQHANAHLIKTSPELYEALEDCIGMIHAWFGSTARLTPDSAASVARAKSTLAKARGEQS